MLLREMSAQYAFSEQAIALRIAELKDKERSEANEEERVRLRRRIADLRPLQIQCRELEQHTKNYYNRRQSRNGKYIL